ncbi:MAG: hypothetical protein U0354_08000 [Candidatus Sericytochromatia bacterium]
MKKFIVILSFLLVNSCAQAVNTINQSLNYDTFSRADAIRVFECSLTKEKDTTERFKLEAKLALNKSMSDESWVKLVNMNKQGTFNDVNETAKKYNCF